MKKWIRNIIIAFVVFIIVRTVVTNLSSSNDKKTQQSNTPRSLSSVFVQEDSDDISKQSINVIDNESSADPEETYWNSVPAISSKSEYINYVRNCLDSRKKEIPVKYADGFAIDHSNIYNFGVINKYSYSQIDKNRVKFFVKYRSGIKIADAYLNNDTSELSEEEKNIYNIAAGIVAQSEKEPSLLRKELYLHDAVIHRCTYYTDFTLYLENAELPRFCSVSGVFIDGKANCQGYSEAFCMLCRMAGFDAGIVSGDADNGDGSGYQGHSWNYIVLDGWNYYVDATWDDEAFGSTDTDFLYPEYIYFNVPTEIIMADHKLDEDFTPGNFVKKIDYKYFYCTKEFDGEHFGEYYDTSDSVYNKMIEYIKNGGSRLHYMMIKNNGRVSDQDNDNTEFGNKLGTYLEYRVEYFFKKKTVGEYSFYTIYITSP